MALYLPKNLQTMENSKLHVEMEVLFQQYNGQNVFQIQDEKRDELILNRNTKPGQEYLLFRLECPLNQNVSQMLQMSQKTHWSRNLISLNEVTTF